MKDIKDFQNMQEWQTITDTVVLEGGRFDFSIVGSKLNQTTARLALKNLKVTRLKTTHFVPSNNYEKSNVAYRYGFQGQEKDDEIKGSGNSINYKYRMHDPRIGRFLSVDPLAHLRTWVSPYNFVQNDPIMRTDPTGALDGEYDVIKNEDGTTTTTKISPLGDEDGIDFFHQLNGDRIGDTKVVNNNTGSENWISGGVNLIRGYTQRDNSTNWNSIFSEWKTETGPRNSLMYGRDNTMNQQIRTSNLYLGVRNDYLEKKAWDFNGDITKGKELISFAKYKEGFKSVLLSGTNMTMQMLGTANVSFYDIGNNQRLTIVNDSKTFESYDRLPLPMTWTLDRIPTRATRQTYMWIDNNVEP